MLTAIADINWFAVFLATFASFVFAGTWFSVLVVEQYATALGREYSPKNKPAPIFIIGPLMCTLVTTVASAVLIEALNISSYSDAVAFGALVGVGYHVAVMTNIAINPNMPRPFLYSAINAPYFFLSSIMVSAILVAMR
jgi:Protein of unknown function (DUF1761)